MENRNSIKNSLTMKFSQNPIIKSKIHNDSTKKSKLNEDDFENIKNKYDLNEV